MSLSKMVAQVDEVLIEATEKASRALAGVGLDRISLTYALVAAVPLSALILALWSPVHDPVLRIALVVLCLVLMACLHRAGAPIRRIERLPHAQRVVEYIEMERKDRRQRRAFIVAYPIAVLVMAAASIWLVVAGVDSGWGSELVRFGVLALMTAIPGLLAFLRAAWPTRSAVPNSAAKA